MVSTKVGRTADQSFQTAILEATDNELLVSLSASIAAAVRWTTFLRYRSNKMPRDPMPEHRALFEAIANAGAQVARLATIALVQQAQLDTEAAIEEKTRRSVAQASPIG